MSKRPMVLVFLTAIISVICSILFGELSEETIILPQLTDNPGLAIPRQYWKCGEYEKANNEYLKILSSPEENEDPSLLEYEYEYFQIYHKSLEGKLLGIVSSWSHFLDLALLKFGLILGISGIIACLFKLILKKPLVIFSQIEDFVGNKDINNIDDLINHRLNEIQWWLINDVNDEIYSEDITLKYLGLKTSTHIQDSIKILETAFSLANGTNIFPASAFIREASNLINRPKYLVQGSYHKVGDSTFIDLYLIDSMTDVPTKVWHINLIGDSEGSEIVDAILYPLIHYFSAQKEPHNWEALRYLHYGLRYFNLFYEHIDKINYLEKAHECLLSSLKSDPEYEIAQYNLGLSYIAIGEDKTGRELLLNLYRKSTKSKIRNQAGLNYCISLVNKGETWAYERTQEFLSEILSQEIDDSNLLYKIKATVALLYAKIASTPSIDHKIYVEEVNEIANSLFKDRKLSTSAKATLYNALGIIHVAQECYDEAINNFILGLAILPNDPSLCIGLGEAYLRTEQFDKATDMFNSASIFPVSKEYASYKLGLIYSELGKDAQALESFKKAPHIASSMLALGKIYQDQNEWYQALEIFREVVKLNKRMTDGWSNIVWSIMQMDSDDPTLYAEAENAGQLALSLENKPNQLWHRNFIYSYALLGSQKFDKGLTYAEKCLQLVDKSSPNYSQALAIAVIFNRHIGNKDREGELFIILKKQQRSEFWMDFVNAYI